MRFGGWQICVGVVVASGLVGCGNDTRFGGQHASSRSTDAAARGTGPDDPRSGDALPTGDGGGDTGDGGEGPATDGASDSAGGSGGGTGGAANADGGSGDGAGDGAGDGTTELPDTRSLFWHWPCATQPTPAAPKDANAMVISGGKDYMLERESVRLEIGGAACDPGTGPRDVLFMVDVSDSMRDFLNLGNDPLRKGTCGRNDAVNKVLDTLPDSARVALIAFDGGIKTESTAFLDVAAFRAAYGTVKILCQSGASTNYQKAFLKASELLAKGRVVASHEVYFLSDGEPNSSDVDGHVEAAAVRQKAMIGTLMLAGDETFMKEQLASKDAAGQPLHAKVEDAEDLAAALAALADVEVEKGTVSYGPLGKEGEWKDAKLKDRKDLVFDLDLGTLAPANWTTGFGMKVETVDSRGMTTVSRGTLVWKP